MASFDQFINSVAADGNDGKAFERFCKHFLETSPEYKDQFEKVWLWDDWPKKWSHDKGVDLIAKYKGRDKYCAIQSKCYAAHNTVPYDEVTNFLADSNRVEIEDRILMMSTNRLNEKTSKEVIQGQEKQVVIRDRHYFESLNYDYPAHISELSKAKLKERATPRPHQAIAIDDVEKGLSENDRGQLIMACGTGKTFTTLWIKERLKAKTVLVLLPSLSLLSQTMREWVWGASEPFEALAVCSDPTVGKSKNTDEDISTSEVGKVTSNVEEIKSFLRQIKSKVIFCTYQSSELIQEAQKDENIEPFDLVVCDEAHRCAGKADAGFATILDENKIRARKRLFTTATPRYFGKAVQSAAEGRGVEIIGMEDEEKFGPIVHQLTFGKAINYSPEPLLTDYQVVVVGVNEPMVRDWIAEGEIISAGEDHVTDARTLAAKIAVLKAIKDYKLERLISFHGNIKRAKDFSSDVFEVLEIIEKKNRPSGKIWSKHVDGTMSAGKRRELINNLKTLKSHDIGLLTNARCLSEGVDVPSLDGVAFVDPRGSQVDIIQAVGRAIRKSENKQAGIIILPVFLEQGDDPDSVIDDSNFKPIWDVLKALKAHDEVLADLLDEYRINMGLGISRKSDKFEKIVFDLPTSVDSEFSTALVNQIIEATTSSWYFKFGHLKSYCEQHGKLPPHKYINPAKIKLDGWVREQRTTQAKMSLERQQLLESLPGWSWDPFREAFYEKFNQVFEYYSKHGTSRIPGPSVSPNGKVLNGWLEKQRKKKRDGRLNEYQEAELNKLHDWFELSDPWEIHFEELKKYFNVFGTSKVKSEFVTEDNIRLGPWVSRQRSKYKQSVLEAEKISRLESFNDWSWDPKLDEFLERFKEFEQFCKENGHGVVPDDYKTAKDTLLGRWASHLRMSRDTLSNEKIKILESNSFWSWVYDDTEIWEEGLKHFRDFVKKNGHGRVPQKLKVDSFNLGTWVVTQREKAKKKTLESERLSELQSLGFAIVARDQLWNERFLELKKFKEEFGHCNVARTDQERRALGGWVSAQRSKFRKGKISKERIKLLDSIGFQWERN